MTNATNFAPLFIGRNPHDRTAAEMIRELTDRHPGRYAVEYLTGRQLWRVFDYNTKTETTYNADGTIRDGEHDLLAEVRPAERCTFTYAKRKGVTEATVCNRPEADHCKGSPADTDTHDDGCPLGVPLHVPLPANRRSMVHYPFHGGRKAVQS